MTAAGALLVFRGQALFDLLRGLAHGNPLSWVVAGAIGLHVLYLISRPPRR